MDIIASLRIALPFVQTPGMSTPPMMVQYALDRIAAHNEEPTAEMNVSYFCISTLYSPENMGADTTLISYMSLR